MKTILKFKIITLGMLFLTGSVFAAPTAMSVSSVIPNNTCFGPAAVVTITFTRSGGTGNWNVGNVFTVELSDALGSFSSPIVIGNLTSRSVNPILSTIPLNTSAGSGYKIRVKSSNPSLTSTNTVSFTIKSLDNALFSYSSSNYCKDGQNPTPTINGTLGGTFTSSLEGLVINSSTGVIDLSASIVGTYTVTYTTAGFCSDAQNTQITIMNCGSTELKPAFRKTYVSYSEKLACYIVSGAQQYEWEFTPTGGGTPLVYNWGINNPSILLGWIPDIQDGTTYDVRIRIKVSGVFSSFGNAWQITTPGTASQTQIVPTFCGKVYTSYAELLNAYTVSNATEYEFEFSPIGGGAVVNYNHTSNSIILSWVVGLIDNTSYNVRVRSNVSGVFGSYGNVCQITTPIATSQTQIVPTFCDKVYTSYAELLNAYTVSNATEYEFEFSPVGGGTVVNHIHTSNSIILSWVVDLIDNTSYSVRVRAKVSGSFESYGSTCQITTPTIGLTSLKPNYCGVTYISMANKIACYAVVGAEDYQFEFTPERGGTTLLDTNISTSSSILLNMIPEIQTSTTYDVRVRAKLSGVYQAFGSSCQITTPSSTMVLNDNAQLMSNNEMEAGVITPLTTLHIYPNPNSGEELNVNLENLTPNSTLTITDIYGKTIVSKSLNTNQSTYNVNVKFDTKLTAGLYFITLVSAENKIVEKLIVK